MDAEAVRASFVRFLTMGLGPAGAFRRFITEPEQITAPDERTVVFDCGRPQPLLEKYLSSQYGPLVANVGVAMQNEVDGDQGHGWAQLNEEGMGTGPYRIVEFEPEQQLILEPYEGYWGGWEGKHFERVIFRVVPENETRRQLIERGDVDIVDSLTPEALDGSGRESGPRHRPLLQLGGRLPDADGGGSARHTGGAPGDVLGVPLRRGDRRRLQGLRQAGDRRRRRAGGRVRRRDVPVPDRSRQSEGAAGGGERARGYGDHRHHGDRIRGREVGRPALPAESRHHRHHPRHRGGRRSRPSPASSSAT